MTGATCFSGIGAPEVALPEVNWLWHAEIEKFPSAVMAARRTGSVNLGNVTAADFIAKAQACGPIDLLVAGSPCQAFSVAGNRQSLSDDRGNLTLWLVEVVRAINPRFLLWENVPGVLTTSDNAFGCFLGALVGSGAALVPARGQRWTNAGMVDGPERTAAWAVRDAQHHGVPQRRRRVFVLSGRVGDFGVAQVLFKREGLRGHSAKSREAGTRVTALTSNGVGTCGADDNQAQGGHLIAHCLNVKDGAGRIDGESETFVTCPLTGNPYGDHESRESLLVTHSLRGEGFDASEDGTGRGTPLVPVTMPTLTSNGDAHSGYRDDCGLVPIGLNGDTTPKASANLMPAMRATQGGEGYGVSVGMAVRRLTVTECARLQGFPDNHCDLPGAADGPKYKAYGNSMAVPVIRAIGLALLEIA